jgi:hypothetical protein
LNGYFQDSTTDYGVKEKPYFFGGWDAIVAGAHMTDRLFFGRGMAVMPRRYRLEFDVRQAI